MTIRIQKINMTICVCRCLPDDGFDDVNICITSGIKGYRKKCEEIKVSWFKLLHMNQIRVYD